MTEAQLIRRLERLDREWPSGYTLASMGGSLCLFRSDDMMTERDHNGDDAVDQEKVLWAASRITNTGGDW